MRRNSPPRSIRHQSPPRKRGRVRSLSPLSRTQPAPPGEERRKLNPWSAESNRSKRPRSRSRSREWINRPRDTFDREPFFMPPVDSGRHKRRESPKEKPKNRNSEKPRERDRIHDRPLDLGRVDIKDKEKHHHHRRHSSDRLLNQLNDFEESYLDNQPNHFGGNGGLPKNQDNILDPSSITYDVFVGDHISQDKSRDMGRDRHLQSPRHHQSIRDIHHPPVRDIHNSSSRGNNRNVIPVTHHGKEGSAAERINRLEKLVEKLVEGNVKPEKSVGYNPKDIIPELIPSNNKFTTSVWLNCIHEECLHRNYDEKSSIRFMQDRMTGIIKAWFKSVSNYDFTWPELKMLLTKTFPDNIEFAQTLKLLVARDKTAEETITQYFFSKVYLCEACKITGENAVSCLIDGLSNPFMKQEIKSFNFLTPEALYSEYLSKLPENEVPVHRDHREVREVIPEYANDEFIPLDLDNRGRERNYQIGNRLPYPTDDKNKPLERKKCFTCKKFGHLTVDCRHAPICYNCKKKGHIAAKCHFDTALSIASINSSVAVPHIICYINGREYLSVIDTGCVAVVLKKHIAEDLQLNIRPTLEVLQGYGGKLVAPLGKTEVLLAAGSVQRFTTALVVKNNMQHVPVIIGQEFLFQEGIIFTQNNGQVEIYETKDDK